jgi:hypothetical protein
MQSLPIFTKENLKHFLTSSFLTGGQPSGAHAQSNIKFSYIQLSCFRFFMDKQLSVGVIKLWLDRYIQCWCAVTSLDEFYTEVFSGISTKLSRSGEGSLQNALPSEVLVAVNNAMMAYGLVFRRPDAGALTKEQLAIALKEALQLDVPKVLARSSEKTLQILKRKIEDGPQPVEQTYNGNKRAGKGAAGRGAATPNGRAQQTNQGMCLSFMCHRFAAKGPCFRGTCRFMHAWPAIKDAAWKREVTNQCVHITNVIDRAKVVAGIQTL